MYIKYILVYLFSLGKSSLKCLINIDKKKIVRLLTVIVWIDKYLGNVLFTLSQM